jgi:hypothetical protein
MLIMINEYGFNNTINSNPRAGLPPPQDLRNITVRNQIVHENPPAIEHILSMTPHVDILGKRRSVNSRVSR